MPPATASAPHLNHAATSSARITDRPIRVGVMSHEEELIKLNLSDLLLPKTNDLHVDGLKPSWFARLFGKR